MKTPWTPKTIVKADFDPDGFARYTTNRTKLSWFDAERFDMADEMSDAIMEWATMPNSKEDVEALEVKLNGIARRLREIGGQE